ncbi:MULTISPECIES: hypothetical protein [Corallococcus]|uniref:hypothetical protein n=1 Tax=Corallococcus TaxID=83461 RepID=UPI000ED0A975|nr:MULTISPECIES: hypothetical protein [Corallococcus]NPC68859.1 hypothetical protein [Corallococcus exiguus]NPD26901.1 hypothetical protein [Corallococcus exiguus]RKI03842.1 hypothetical protein D7Y04_02460 [Corallococcus sp. AB038B]
MKAEEYRVSKFELRLMELSKAALAAPERLAPELDPGRAVLRTWHYPSFDHYRVWLLEKKSRGHFEYLRLRRVVWNHRQEREDLVQATNPEDFLRSVPSRIEVTDTDVDAERWQAFEEAAASVVIPPLSFPLRGLSVDGVKFGIEHSFFSHSLRLEWRSNIPKEWKPLARWTQQVQDFFDESIAPAP